MNCTIKTRIRNRLKTRFNLENVYVVGFDLPPLNSTNLNLVKSFFGKENGLEEAIYGRADYWISEAGRGWRAGQG
ncbi:MAG: hypothetical protein KKE21_09475, partial [Gammaproteobacteria bacterium]|nr:hypothetical protein [Gammaproteobacteria bacterium]MBU1893132.1 hypothetical protein [Gammaproteobacteria bacterium]